MPSTALVALLLLVVAVTFWQPLRAARRTLGVGHLVSTGHAFLVLGYFIGLAFGARPQPIIEDIAPIVAFVAGWVGFATGMRFEWKVLRPVPRRAYLVAFVPAIAAAAAVGLVGLAVFLVAGLALSWSIAASLILAAAAATSGPTLAAIVRTRRAGRSPATRSTLRMVEFSAGIDEALVVLLAILGFALARPVLDALDPASLIGFSLGGGAVLGVTMWLFLGGQASEDERMLLSLAMLAFIAGFGGWLLMSPAAVATVAAVVVANLPGDRMTQLFQTVRRVERPAVVILMTVIGFHISGDLSWIFAPLLVAMTAIRMAAKHLAGKFVTGPVGKASGLTASPGWTHGLMPQGLMGLMIALSFFHVWRNDVSRSVLAAVAVGSLLNEIIAPAMLVRMIRMQSGAQPSAETGGK